KRREQGTQNQKKQALKKIEISFSEADEPIPEFRKMKTTMDLERTRQGNRYSGKYSNKLPFIFSKPKPRQRLSLQDVTPHTEKRYMALGAATLAHGYEHESQQKARNRVHNELHTKVRGRASIDGPRTAVLFRSLRKISEGTEVSFFFYLLIKCYNNNNNNNNNNKANANANLACQTEISRR
ncbi:hypothetical protein RFI_21525, partial [Reticulomyxa filosa]